MQIVAMGFLTALAFIIIMWKVNLPFFANYQWQTDVAVSGGLMFLFLGTFNGMMIAVIAGIFISIFLFIAGKCIPKRTLKNSYKPRAR